MDYHKTFALVAKYNNVKVITLLASTMGWDIYHMDVKSAYLNSHLKETVYMRQPPGHITKGQESLVCQLYQSLYGLKQSSQNWNRKINIWLQKHGL